MVKFFLVTLQLSARIKYCTFLIIMILGLSTLVSGRGNGNVNVKVVYPFLSHGAIFLAVMWEGRWRHAKEKNRQLLRSRFPFPTQLCLGPFNSLTKKWYDIYVHRPFCINGFLSVFDQFPKVYSKLTVTNIYCNCYGAVSHKLSTSY